MANNNYNIAVNEREYLTEPPFPRGVERFFSDATWRVLLRAREKAQGLRHQFLGTNHLLMSLLQEESVREILAGLGVEVQILCDGIRSTTEPNPPDKTIESEMGITLQAKWAVTFATLEVLKGNLQKATPLNLLEGLTRMRQSFAGEVLARFGVTYQKLQKNLSKEPKDHLPA